MASKRDSLLPKLRDIGGHSRGSWWPVWDTSAFTDMYVLRASQQRPTRVPTLSYDAYIGQIERKLTALA